MSDILNSPIILDETGQMLYDELQRQNGYMAMLAEGEKEEIYDSMAQIAHIIRANDVETNKKIFNIGDQLIMPWKDMDDTAHNTDEKAYQVAWDIVHHGLVTLQDGSVVPGMFIQMHLCSAYGVQFSHQQAFMNCGDGLAAGTYYVLFNGNAWSFTLTQPVPAGGRLSGFESGSSASSNVKSWANPSDANPIETVAITNESNGTFLGSMISNRESEDGLNCHQRVQYGSNRWSTSAIRQYLNASGQNWFSSKDKFDIRPDQYNKHGFMSGFGSDFLSAIKPVKVTTALNTVEGYDNATEDTFDTFFLPSLEQINTTPQLRGVEGDTFEYWKAKLGLSGFAATYPNVYDAFKIPAINAGSPQTVRLRSASRGSAFHTWLVNSSGYVNSNYASHASRFSPVCVIC